MTPQALAPSPGLATCHSVHLERHLISAALFLWTGSFIIMLPLEYFAKSPTPALIAAFSLRLKKPVQAKP